MLEKEGWHTRAGRLICLSIAFAAIYLVLKYAISALLPFLAALAIGAFIFSLSRKSSERLGGKRRAWAVFYVSVFWTLLLTVVSLLVKQAVSEAGEIIAFLSESSDEIGDGLKSAVDSITALPARIPALSAIGNIGGDIKELSSNVVEAVVNKGGSALAAAVGKMVMSTPSAFLSVVVCVLASAYIALDLDCFREYFLGLLSCESRRRISSLTGRIFHGIRGYSKAYFWLYLINFTVLYAGLKLLRIEYAFVISLILALLDVLPLFSAGVVLIPWGILLIVGGNVFSGIGMIAVFAVLSVTRQIAEPALVGKGLGIHPLASLASMYIGFRLFGFWGMMLSPLVMLAVKEVIESGKKEEKIGEKT